MAHFVLFVLIGFRLILWPSAGKEPSSWLFGWSCVILDAILVVVFVHLFLLMAGCEIQPYRFFHLLETSVGFLE